MYLEILIEHAANIVSTLLITLIGVLGAWLSAKLARRLQLDNINKAKDEVIKAAEQTVRELQQTFVTGWKAAHADGKLTNDEVKELGTKLIDGVLMKMSTPTFDLLTAAEIDIEALVTSAAEAYIDKRKNAWEFD